MNGLFWNPCIMSLIECSKFASENKKEVDFLTAIEILSVVFNLIYLVLLIKENIWCWPNGIIASILSVYLFVEAKLYSEAICRFGSTSFFPDGSRRSTRVCCLFACSFGMISPHDALLCVVVCGSTPVWRFSGWSTWSYPRHVPGIPTQSCMHWHASFSFWLCALPWMLWQLPTHRSRLRRSQNTHQAFNTSLASLTPL